MKETTIWQLIDEIDLMDDKASVFYIKTLPFTMHTACFLMEEAELSALSHAQVFEHFLSVGEIAEVVKNVREQVKDPADELFLDALQLYKANGALMKVC